MEILILLRDIILKWSFDFGVDTDNLVQCCFYSQFLSNRVDSMRLQQNMLILLY